MKDIALPKKMGEDLSWKPLSSPLTFPACSLETGHFPSGSDELCRVGQALATEERRDSQPLRATGPNEAKRHGTMLPDLS